MERFDKIFFTLTVPNGIVVDMATVFLTNAGF